jgi:hypothetical protein
MDNQNKNKEFLISPDFKKALNYLAQTYKITTTQKIQIINLFAELLEGKIDLFDISSEIEKRLKINFDKAVQVSASLYDIYDRLVPKEIKKSLESSPAELVTPKGNNLEEIIADIKNTANLKLDMNLAKRFEDIVFSWLRNIRDEAETLDRLNRGAKIGGLELSMNQATNLFNILKNKKAEYEAQGINLAALINQEMAKSGEVMPKKEIAEEEIDVQAKANKLQPAQEPITGTDTTISQLLQDKGITFEELAQKEAIKKELGQNSQDIKISQNPLVAEIEAKEELLESHHEISLPQAAQPKFQQEISASAVQIAPAAPVNQVKAEIKQPYFKRSVETSRPIVEDVKVMSEPQLIGPIDELAVFKIEDFRRLSKNPLEAANRLKNKLELLEDESIVKKGEGIKALKSSPLYKAYSDIMNQAIKEGRSIVEIIKAASILSEAEFKAIMELNKSLKY